MRLALLLTVAAASGLQFQAWEYDELVAGKGVLLQLAVHDQAANDTETMEAVSIDAMSEGRSELTQTRWSRFFNGAGEKIDGRMIDGLRVSIQETIENSGSHQQQSKKQKKGEGGPSGA